MKIICSSRNFFPLGAWAYSSEKQLQLARKAGYDGICFLPTWRFVYEIFRYNKLLIPNDTVFAGHRDWRHDRIMEATVRRKPWWLYQFRNKEDLLFPPSNICLRALKQLQKIYKIPVSTMWLADADNFSPVMLEVWDPIMGLNHKQLLMWLRKKSNERSIVIDTVKFTNWLKTNDLTKEKERVIKELLPYTKQVEYRAITSNRVKSLAVSTGIKMSESDELFRLLLNKGYKGDIVIEFGWPDFEKRFFGLLKEDTKSFIKFHQDLITKIRSLLK